MSTTDPTGGPEAEVELPAGVRPSRGPWVPGALAGTVENRGAWAPVRLRLPLGSHLGEGAAARCGSYAVRPETWNARGKRKCKLMLYQDGSRAVRVVGNSAIDLIATREYVNSTNY